LHVITTFSSPAYSTPTFDCHALSFLTSSAALCTLVMVMVTTRKKANSAWQSGP